MAHGSTPLESRYGRDGSSDGGPSIGIPGLALALATVVAFAHPNPLVVAVLSAALVLGGFCWATVIALRRRRDRAGGLSERTLLPALIVFFGFIAAVLSDSDRVVRSLPI